MILLERMTGRFGHLSRLPQSDTVCRVKSRILRLNAAEGIIPGPRLRFSSNPAARQELPLRGAQGSFRGNDFGGMPQNHRGNFWVDDRNGGDRKAHLAFSGIPRQTSPLLFVELALVFRGRFSCKELPSAIVDFLAVRTVVSQKATSKQFAASI